MWMTTSGRAAATAAASASESRTSPSMLSMPSPTRASSYSDGSVGHVDGEAGDAAPSDCSHSDSQRP